MQITLFSLFMSVVWSSVLAAFNYFCRKKHYFIRQLGITNILFLYLFFHCPYACSLQVFFYQGNTFQGGVRRFMQGCLCRSYRDSPDIPGINVCYFLGGRVNGSACTFLCPIPESHARIFSVPRT